MPLPMPRLAPVTIATLPSSRIACQISFSRSFTSKDDANRTARAHHLTGGFQRAARLVDRKGRDAVAGLIGGVQETAGGIEGEVARLAALGRLPADGRQQTRVWVDREDHDAVVATIRRVQVIARQVQGDLGAGAALFEVRGQAGGYLQLGEFAAVCMESIRGDRRVQLVDDIQKRCVWMKSGVPRTRAWFGLD